MFEELGTNCSTVSQVIERRQGSVQGRPRWYWSLQHCNTSSLTNSRHIGEWKYPVEFRMHQGCSYHWGNRGSCLGKNQEYWLSNCKPGFLALCYSVCLLLCRLIILVPQLESVIILKCRICSWLNQLNLYLHDSVKNFDILWQAVIDRHYSNKTVNIMQWSDDLGVWQSLVYCI